MSGPERLEVTELHRRMLLHIFRQGQATRQSLVEALGCTLLTVSKAVTALLDAGLLQVDGTVSSTAGRRTSVLKLNPRHRMCLCADIGFGGVRVGLVRLDGAMEKMIALPRLENPVSDGIPYEEMLRAMDALAADAGRERLLGIGVGISGMVQYERGQVLFCPNIGGFNERPLADELSERFRLPTLVDTSARCMTMGEYRFGAGRGVDNQLYVSLGTGSIAAGILADGRLYRGPSGFAGEIGHTCVRSGLRRQRCSCGGYDCLEIYATLHMLCVEIEEQLRKFEGYSAARQLLDGGRLTLENLRAVYRSGDAVVAECFSGALKDVASVLTGAVNLYAPSQVIVGGGLPMYFPETVGILERGVLENCLTPLRSRLRLVPATLGGESALRGAAAMMIEKWFGEE